MGSRRGRTASAAGHPAAGNAAGRQADRCRNVARCSGRSIRAGRRSTSCSRSWGLDRSVTRGCRSYRAVRNNVSPWPARWRANRNCCFSTNRRPGSDPQSRRQLWEVLERFRADGGTILITTHYMDEAHALCDRVGIMDQGKLIALGTPARAGRVAGRRARRRVRARRRIVASTTSCSARCRACAMCAATRPHLHLSTSELHLTVPALLDFLRQRQADAEPARHPQRHARGRVRDADGKAVAR